MNNPKNQTTDTIVESLLSNTSRQYTESAHAEIFRRLINTMKEFNDKTERIEKVMLYLAVAQVVLAVTQIIVAIR
ncbi:MAG TPA: hypothetical protein DCX25_02740 [Candidatus Pacebacteria bacterium]|nr:MAG: hypothetical protein UX00_C0004G0028 [Microgenomates group bacterium GW2011_GWB1_45_17]KKU24633.1 MAG: hypothetical protein UX36_C0001G0250 [Microgenomates group bacterium GW2011_GWC1_46_15]HAV15222.1 hypothetical protein [Candidatus Paceibacterota bacterium]